jgi:squalene monooxygenase
MLLGRHILVVGGGFVGMSAAAALSSRGAKVTVLETLQGPVSQFRGELIHPRGVRALNSLGLLDPLIRAGAVGVEGFAAVPGAEQPAVLLPYPHSGGHGLGIDHGKMVMALRKEVARRPHVTLRTQSRVEDVVRQGNRVSGVKLADGTVIEADLVVAADGRYSRLRKAIGLEPEVELVSYTVAVSCEGPVLPWGMRGHVFLGAPGPILAYPYGANLTRMCIDVPVGLAKGKEQYVKLIRAQYAQYVPEPLRSAMLSSLAHHPFEGCATHVVETEACAAPGIALVGDAGGCNHPLTAGGMTSGMNDVLVLAECLSEGDHSDDALVEYQKQRYRFIRMRSMFTEALYEVFRGTDAGSKTLQAGVFRYWKRSARARKSSMGILSGDESRPVVFMTEYARVLGLSTLDVLDGLIAEPSVRGGYSRMKSLLKTSLGRLEVSGKKTVRMLWQVPRMRLSRVPATPTPPRRARVA